MPGIDEISHAIGQLQGEMRALTTSMSKNTDTTESTRDEVRQLSTKLEIVSQDVASIKPAAARFQKWEQRAMGVAGVATFLGSIAGSELIQRIKGFFS